VARQEPARRTRKGYSRTMAYVDLPARYYRLLEAEDDVVLLETLRYNAENRRSFAFLNPTKVLRIHRIAEVGALLREIERATRDGYYAAGYLGYECGAYFEPVGADLEAYHPAPLAWFGLYAAPLIFDHRTGRATEPPGLDARLRGAVRYADRHEADVGRAEVAGGPEFDWSAAAYAERIAAIKEYIRAGDTYQINFTGHLHFTLDGSPLALYRTLRRKQPVAYGAYLRTGTRHILSFSPELFFRIERGGEGEGERIITRPMKGTAPRGRTPDEDRRIAMWLRGDEKSRAENVMIVDLLRNDLGRLCRVGSVRVPSLFTVERYATLFQMTSTVTGTLAGEMDTVALFRSLFPCGSVTGAPKVRSMRIIRELEISPRGVYTGAIGYFAPRGAAPATIPRAAFSVAIRTITLDEGRGEMGVGGGIVYDSTAEDEYAECLLKARFLTEPPTDFALIETILWRGGYRRLDLHLRRLRRSATYFGYPFDQRRIGAALARQARAFEAGERYKVRLTLDRAGVIECESIRIEAAPAPGPETVVLATERTDSRDRFLFHKTTNRARYDAAYQRAARAGHADVIFLNERGEVTEGAISNIFVRRGSHWLTPPVACGLLDGVFRQWVLRMCPRAREAVLTPRDLAAAEEIAICNAIRGWRRVTLRGEPGVPAV
jgi:para-aminobenzoate synthetase / 4-amino-4-deoxychorismate lyase